MSRAKTTSSSQIQLPKLRRQPRPGGHDRAFFVLHGRRHYVGRWGTPEAEQRYRQLIAESLTTGHVPSTTPGVDPDITIVEVVDGYWKHLVRRYGKAKAKERSVCSAMKLLLKLYADTAAADFGPRRLAALRAEMVVKGWLRSNINRQISEIRSIFKWAVARELVAPSVLHGLQALEPLREGEATEGKAVAPVPLGHVRAVRRRLPRPVRGLVDLMLLTGARPSELVGLRALDIDTSGPVWSVVLAKHKMAHAGRDRTIWFGPRAQRILRQFMLDRPMDQPLFSPKAAVDQLFECRHASRQTPLNQGNKPGTNRKKKPKRSAGDAYTSDSLRRAITRACKAAGVPPWTPYQLRHTAATLYRKRAGLEAAALVLGHASASLTDAVYAERDRGRILDVVRKLG